MELSKKIKLHYFLLLGLLILIGCKTFRSSPVKNINDEKNAIVCPVKLSFPVNNEIVSFITQYCDIDDSVSKDSMNVLLKDLAQKYYLRQLSDSSYYLCGFIKTDALFDENKFKDRGIKMNSSIDNLRSVCIPLSSLKFFFTQDHILSFDADMPAYPAKK